MSRHTLTSPGRRVPFGFATRYHAPVPPISTSSSGNRPSTVPHELPGSGPVSDYAATLLGDLDVPVTRVAVSDTAVSAVPRAATSAGSLNVPIIRWAASGAMALTGEPTGPPLAEPVAPAVCASGALEALRALTGDALPADLDGAALLGERAAIFGLGRRGRIAPSGSCRLLQANDGWIAVNLPRPDDIDLLPAWLGENGSHSPAVPWSFIAERVAAQPSAKIVARGRLLGLAVARAAALPRARQPWLRVTARGPSAFSTPARDGACMQRPFVVDLSALWAGPLCSHLLGLAGARVVKVESTHRPDGARRGPKRFFDLLNAGKQSVALDFRDPTAHVRLARLLETADIVIEGSRPRALAQMGIDATRLVRRRPGLVWVSITGYGRSPRRATWIAYGDDAAAAAGLLARCDHNLLFCGDAIADPLTGIHAAVAAWAAWQAGFSRLLDISLCAVAAHVATLPLQQASAQTSTVEPAEASDIHGNRQWRVVTEGTSTAVAAPRAREPIATARPLGADTDEVLAILERSC